MLLMLMYEVMECVGIVFDIILFMQCNCIGVFYGVISNDWMEINMVQNIDMYFIMGGNRGFIFGCINFCFEFLGLSYSNDIVCLFSLVVIYLVCNLFWCGDCDIVVVGGINMIFMFDGYIGFDKGFFLFCIGNCKLFDDVVDGYCCVEGVGIVFIK